MTQVTLDDFLECIETESAVSDEARTASTDWST